MIRVCGLRRRERVRTCKVTDGRQADDPFRSRFRKDDAAIGEFGEHACFRSVAGTRKGQAGNGKMAAWPVALVLLAALVAGCGSGQTIAGRDAASLPSPVVSDDYAGHHEYRAAWGLAATKAAVAYNRIAGRDGEGIAPGAGARVAVIDTGIDSGHREFDKLAITGTGPDHPDGSHGTAVSSVIAAGRSGAGTPPGLADGDFHGLAWGLDRIEVKRVSIGSGDPNENFVGTAPADVDNRVKWLAEQFSGLGATADFVNMSFVAKGLIENYRNLSFGPLYAPAIMTVAQTGKPAAKAVLVIAAGNDHGDKCVAPEPNCVGGNINASSPALYAGLPVLESSLRGHVVAVVATNRKGQIAPFSNRCGIAAKWCIAAPGHNIPIAHSDGQSRGYSTASGTSLAAPHVTGGLAVLKHWFRSQLGNEALLARLYETAQVTPDIVSGGSSCPAHLDLDGDLGDCELSSDLGRGLMDLGAATAPVGTTSIVLGGSAADGGPSSGSSWIAPGAPAGDALRRSLAGREIVVFDTLGAPFWIDAGRFVHRISAPGGAALLSRWLAHGADNQPRIAGHRRQPADLPENRLRIGFGPPAGAHVAGLVSSLAAAELRFGSTSLSTFASTGSGDETGLHGVDGGAHGFALSWALADEQARLRAGWIGERKTFLGSGAQGAFGALSSNLFFVGASNSFEVDGWRLGLAAELGWAMPETAGGMLAGTETTAYSTAFSAEAVHPFAGGTLRFSLEQPLRIEAGRMDLRFPAGRTPAGTVEHKRIRVGLSPSGRQLDLGIDWTRPLAAGAVWRAGAILSREPGHDAIRDAEAMFLTGLHFRL